MPSFDVVCTVDSHEVDNAVEQARKEVLQRFDFRGTETEIERTKEGIVLKSNSEGRLDAARQVLEEKMVRRKVSLKSLDPDKAQPAGGSSWRQVIRLREGIGSDEAKNLVKLVKDSKLKVQPSIQGDVVRISGKKRDDLQECIGMLKAKELPLPLQYTNFRD